MSGYTPSSPRDTIQISLGPTANAITAHSLNLQGLACTAGDSEEDNSPVCDPLTTHTLERNHWVPRVLLVDEPTRFFVSSQVSQQQLQVEAQPNTLPSILGTSSPFAIQPLDPALSLQHEEPQAWNQFLNSASVLAYSSHSRYYQEPAAQGYRASASNPRHVVWDDDEEEEEEEDPQERKWRMQREAANWKTSTEAPLQEQLSSLAENMGPSNSFVDVGWNGSCHPFPTEVNSRCLSRINHT